MQAIGRIVFVCTGNICRSPMALACARQETAERRIAVELDSAGTGALVGSPASRNAVDACEERDMDITAHRAKSVEETPDTDDTLWVVMTPQHAKWLQHIAGIPAERITLLGSGIPDPYGGDLDVYRRTRDILQMEVRELFDRLDDLLCHKDGSRRPKITEPSDEPETAEEERSEPDMMPVITAMSPEDIPEAASLEIKCFSDPWSEKALAESLADPCAVMLAALLDGVLCGYCCIMLAGDGGYIPRVAVRPAYRRRGVATALMLAAEEAAREQGSELVTLEVRESNLAAISLYTSLGYRSVGRRPGFYTAPIEAAIVMQRELPAEQ